MLVGKFYGGGRGGKNSYLVGVVQVQDIATATINLLVAPARAAHHQRGVHVHVVAREIEGDEALEDDRPARESGGEEDQQTRRRAAIRHHI